ncbi:MAG: ribokinase [Proteobacteria bacterium]|nr:ribokinase [Pseudomonadota bacterium]
MAGTPRIAVIGSANTDLITYSDRFPRPGETLFGKDFSLGFGGKGANQAIAARLCGAEVTMVAKVGDDLFGEATVKNFAALGVDTRHVRVVQGVSTGVAPIFVEPGGQNRIIVVKGANEQLSPADVDAAAEDLRRADIIILQFEIPLETVYHAVRFARSHGIRCIVNPAPALPADLQLLTTADYFIPNETEAEILTSKAVQTLADARACADALLQQGFSRVVITLGARGAWVAATDGASHVPPFAVATHDTSGAGDAFIGSFAAFLAEGQPQAQALARASLYAALSTTRPGTQKSFLTRAAFESEWAQRIGGS